jgi:4,4'-diaponeurosporenoate glycosyltransferase
MQIEIVLLIVTLALWLAGWIVLGRVRPCSSVESATATDVAKSLSIIIPARNEAANLPTLLKSIASQSVRPLEVIVVNDASTDRTEEIAQQFGARVIAAESLPDGWRGKTWACHQGAQAACGDLFLFLDADTWFEPDGLGRVIGEFQAMNDGVLSVAPHHRVSAFHEQGSAFFNLVMLAGTGAFTLRGDDLLPRGLLGQFMLIGRENYQRVGGHEAVRSRILENFWLAEQLARLGVPLRCRGGRGVFAFRMYPSGWAELIEGWTKGFASGAGQTPLPILLLIVLWMIGLMLAPLGLVLFKASAIWIVAYLYCVIQLLCLFSRVGTFHWLTGIFYPLPLVVFFVVFTRSVMRSKRKQSVTWKGREIRAD